MVLVKQKRLSVKLYIIILNRLSQTGEFHSDLRLENDPWKDFNRGS